MKKTILLVCLFLAAFSASAQPVTFMVGDGLDNGPLKEKINANISQLLTEMNKAYAESRALDLAEVAITAGAVRSLGMLWRNRPFRCDEAQVVERILRTYDGGYQLRTIPMEMTDILGKVRYPELVIDMDSAGTITLVNFAVEADLYRKFITPGSDGKDLLRRQRILDYAEQLRTAFNRKDLNFLEVYFCDDALIFTGKLVKQYVRDQAVSLKSGIESPKTSKAEFLASLRRVLPQAKYIQSHFSDIQVIRHPERESLYGVRVKLGYESPIAFEEGYSFMLWDFSDETHPQVLVRTWQPCWTDEAHTRPLDESQIIDINSFDLK